MLWGYVLHGKRFQTRIFFGDYCNRGIFCLCLIHRLRRRASVVLSEEGVLTSLSMPPRTNSIIGTYFGRWVIYTPWKVSFFGHTAHICRRGHIARLPRRGRVHQLLPAKNVSKTSMFDQMFWMLFGTIFSGVWLICSGQLDYTLNIYNSTRNWPGHLLFILILCVLAGCNHVHHWRV